MIPLPPLDQPAFSVSHHSWQQLEAVEREIRPWLAGTDDSKGSIPLPVAVQCALVMAYQAGLAEGRQHLTNTPEEIHPWQATVSPSSETPLATLS